MPPRSRRPKRTQERKPERWLIEHRWNEHPARFIYSSPVEGDVFGFGTINVIRSPSSSVVSTLIFPPPKPYICTADENIFPVIERPSAGGPALAKTRVADAMHDNRTAAITPLFVVGFFAVRIN